MPTVWPWNSKNIAEAKRAAQKGLVPHYYEGQMGDQRVNYVTPEELARMNALALERKASAPADRARENQEYFKQVAARAAAVAKRNANAKASKLAECRLLIAEADGAKGGSRKKRKNKTLRKKNL